MRNFLFSQEILKNRTQKHGIIVRNKNFSSDMNSALGLSVLGTNINEKLFEPFLCVGLVRHEINMAVLSKTAFDNEEIRVAIDGLAWHFPTVISGQIRKWTRRLGLISNRHRRLMHFAFSTRTALGAIVTCVRHKFSDTVESFEHVVLNHEFQIIIIAMRHTIVKKRPFHCRITISSNHDSLIRSGVHVNKKFAIIRRGNGENSQAGNKSQNRESTTMVKSGKFTSRDMTRINCAGRLIMKHGFGFQRIDNRKFEIRIRFANVVNRNLPLNVNIGGGNRDGLHIQIGTELRIRSDLRKESFMRSVGLINTCSLDVKRTPRRDGTIPFSTRVHRQMVQSICTRRRDVRITAGQRNINCKRIEISRIHANAGFFHAPRIASGDIFHQIGVNKTVHCNQVGRKMRCVNCQLVLKQKTSTSTVIKLSLRTIEIKSGRNPLGVVCVGLNKFAIRNLKANGISLAHAPREKLEVIQNNKLVSAGITDTGSAVHRRRNSKISERLTRHNFGKKLGIVSVRIQTMRLISTMRSNLGQLACLGVISKLQRTAFFTIESELYAKHKCLRNIGMFINNARFFSEISVSFAPLLVRRPVFITPRLINLQLHRSLMMMHISPLLIDALERTLRIMGHFTIHMVAMGSVVFTGISAGRRAVSAITNGDHSLRRSQVRRCGTPSRETPVAFAFAFAVLPTTTRVLRALALPITPITPLSVRTLALRIEVTVSVVVAFALVITGSLALALRRTLALEVRTPGRRRIRLITAVAATGRPLLEVRMRLERGGVGVACVGKTAIDFLLDHLANAGEIQARSRVVELLFNMRHDGTNLANQLSQECSSIHRVRLLDTIQLIQRRTNSAKLTETDRPRGLGEVVEGDIVELFGEFIDAGTDVA